MEEERLKALFPMPWYKDTIHHGGQVLFDLVEPWLGTNQLVGGDSYFASVSVAAELESTYNMGFIGAVKTATKGFPQQYLSSVVCTGERGGKECILLCFLLFRLLDIVTHDKWYASMIQ